jgi:tetratricopeptide (TPR) repeat protein
VKAGFGFLSDDEQLDQLEPMVEQASRLGDLRMEADIRLHDGLLRMFRGERPASSPRLAATLKRVDEIAAQIGDPVIGALPKSIVGLFQVFTGDLRDGVRALEEAAPLLGRKHDFVGSSFALMALGMGLARLGRFDEALGTAGRAIEVAQDGDVIARIDALIGKSAVDAIRGDYDAAIPAALECTRMAEESGATACVVSSAYLTGEALLQQKKFADAQISFERSLSIANMTNERMFRPLASASLHATMASLGQPPVQHGLSIDAALAQTRESHDAWGEAIVLSKRAEAEFQKPADQRDEGRMLTDYAAAYAAFEEMGARPFWARVLRDWGHALLATGSTVEGRAKLREALAELDALGIAAEADAVRTELAA